MSVGGTDDLDIKRENGLGWMILNRPRKANALTVTMQIQMIDFLAEAAVDEHVRAVILTAEGSRNFCGGADYTEILANTPAEQTELRSRTLFDCCLALVDFGKPLIAAVNGTACGSGFLLALLADIRLATADATFSLPEISRGQPTFAGAALLSRMCGDLIARDLVLSGRSINATEARKLNLLQSIVPGDELRTRAGETAMRLSEHASRAYRLNKKWVYRDYRALLEEAAHASVVARTAAPAS